MRAEILTQKFVMGEGDIQSEGRDTHSEGRDTQFEGRNTHSV